MAITRKSYAWIDAYEKARKRHGVTKSKELATKMTLRLNKKKKR
jgi:hypothetical protein